MAHEKNHDFHILPPSIWPLASALGAFIMLFGAVTWMHDSGPYVFLIGLAGVLYVMYAWWSDVVGESEVGDHTAVVRIGLRYGVIMFIMSEVMFFAAWFWSFFKHAMYPMGPMSPLVDGVWPPAGIETFDAWHLPLINTLILLCSGMAATWAHHALVHENNRKDVHRHLHGLTAGRPNHFFDFALRVAQKAQKVTTGVRREKHHRTNDQTSQQATPLNQAAVRRQHEEGDKTAQCQASRHHNLRGVGSTAYGFDVRCSHK